MNTNFQDKKMPKEKTPCKSLSIKNSVIKAKKKYYLQTLLDECKYEPKKIKMENLINDDLEKCSSMSLTMKQIIILMMKQNLIMMNLTNNLVKAKNVF